MSDEPGGISIVSGITSSTVVKASAGRVALVSVVSSLNSSPSCAVHDCATIGAVSASNQIWRGPSGFGASGIIASLQLPCANGIVVIPGAGQSLTVSYT